MTAGFVLLLALLALAPTTVVVCHHPGALEDPFGKPVTITIPVGTLDQHLRHGDTLGPCGATPTPTPTPRPTARPTPRPTPRPTSTPTPTATPRPTPSPSSSSPSATPPDVTPPATDTE